MFVHGRGNYVLPKNTLYQTYLDIPKLKSILNDKDDSKKEILRKV